MSLIEVTPEACGWVKVKDVPGAPTSFQLMKNGVLVGWHETNGVKHGAPLSEEDLKRWGYRKASSSVR